MTGQKKIFDRVKAHEHLPLKITKYDSPLCMKNIEISLIISRVLLIGSMIYGFVKYHRLPFLISFRLSFNISYLQPDLRPKISLLRNPLNFLKKGSA